MFAASFPVFLLSRVVGGLTEGNVQMSIAMISDVTEPKTRSRSLAWVGIAFAAGFSIGPPLGAYLAGFDMRLLLPKWPVNAFSAPALFAFILIIVETVYMVLYLPETRPQSTPPVAQSQSDKRTANIASIESKNVLARLGLVHFIFLFVFSGMEFTLVFLTFDRFGFSNMQQGYLLAFVGVFSALIQGGYVRRMAHKVGERRLVIQGIASCSIGLFIIGVSERTELLYLGAVFLSFTSGTVVTSLTALASMSQAKVGMGRALGSFRSAGQLGRALGPVSACTAYWVFGSTRAYLSASLALLVLVICTHILIPKQQKQDAKQD